MGKGCEADSGTDKGSPGRFSPSMFPPYDDLTFSQKRRMVQLAEELYGEKGPRRNRDVQVAMRLFKDGNADEGGSITPGSSNLGRAIYGRLRTQEPVRLHAALDG